MSHLESGHAGHVEAAAHKALPELQRFRFNERQRDHIHWLIERCGAPVIWTAPVPIGAGHKLVLVTKPPTGPQVETFCRSLTLDTVVVIPFGENPLFDFLKSKLTGYGAVAPSGAEGPHTLWWGGLDFPNFKPARHTEMPLVISCFEKSSEPARAAAGSLVESLKALGLSHHVEPVHGLAPASLTSLQKVQFILKTLQEEGRPVLYVEPTAVFKRSPALLTQIECDVAVHRWGGWELSSRTAYFGCSAEAIAVVETWARFAASCPEIDEGYLLDQAWSLVSSQASLRTVWLPRSYHSTAEDSETFDIAVIQHDLPATTRELNPLQSFPSPLRAARRAGRTGSPEAQLVVRSANNGDKAAVVILRDVQRSGVADATSAMRDIADAFNSNPGRFSQIELSLCRWDEDFNAAVTAGEQADACIIVIEPTSYIWNRMFADLSGRVAADPKKRRFRIPPRDAQEATFLQ